MPATRRDRCTAGGMVNDCSSCATPARAPARPSTTPDPADALGPIVVLERIFGGLVLPAVHDPGGEVQRRADRHADLGAGHALGTPEPLQLGGGGGEVERGVVTFVAERSVEPAHREGDAVSDRRDGGHVEAVQADFRLDRLGAELLDAGIGTDATEV